MTRHRLTRIVRRTAHHATVALSVMGVTLSSILPPLAASATPTVPPQPLHVTHADSALEPGKFLLTADADDGWATDSEGLGWQNGSSFEPFARDVNGIPYVPYRTHTLEDGLAVEIPSVAGRQLVVFSDAGPVVQMYEYAESTEEFTLVAEQRFSFQLQDDGGFEVAPDPSPTASTDAVVTPTPSETPTPEPTPTDVPTTPSETPTPDVTETPTPTPTPSPEPSDTPTPDVSPMPTEILTPTPDATETPTPSPTPSEAPSPTPSETPTPEPIESPSAFHWLYDLFRVPDAHAQDIALTLWEPTEIGVVTVSAEYGADTVTVLQRFTLRRGGAEWDAEVRAIFGFADGTPLNKWTYTVFGDDDREFRMTVRTTPSGDLEAVPGDARGAWRVMVPESDALTLDLPAAASVPLTEETPSTDVPASASAEPPPPVDEPPVETQIEDAPSQDEPTPEPEETLLPVEELVPDDILPAVASPATDVEETSLFDRLIRWLVPVAYADEGDAVEDDSSLLDDAVAWVQELVDDEESLEFTFFFDVRDHRGDVQLTQDGNVLVAAFGSDPELPAGTAFFVDPSFGAAWNDAGVTVQSGDGSQASDFRLHFNPLTGGAVDELYIGTDFSLNRVATPASDSGGLTLVNPGTNRQAGALSSLSVVEQSSVRIVVQNELTLTASAGAPVSLKEQYAIYPSGRVVKKTVVDTPAPLETAFYFNSAASASGLAYVDEEGFGQMHLSEGPDPLLYWQDPLQIASASYFQTEGGGSRNTAVIVPMEAGQHTYYQLMELTQYGLTLLDEDSYRRFADDYRSPDDPSMTRGSFLGFSFARAAYQFEAVNNVVVFRLDGLTIPRINPVFEVYNWSDPDLGAFKAQLNGLNMVEGVDYAIDFKHGDASTGVLLFQYLHTVDADDAFLAEGDETLPPLFDLDPNDAAAIKRVQRGTVTGTGTQFTVTLPFAVVTSRAFATGGSFLGGGTSTTSSNPNDSRLTYWLASPTELRIIRDVGDTTASTSWQVVEFEDNSGAFVQRGSSSMAGGTGTVNASLPTTVNTNQAFALISVRTNIDADTANDERWTVRASLSPTTLNLTRNETTTNTVNIAWQVIQLAGVNVQRGLTTLTAVNQNVTVGSAATNKSFVVMSGRAAAAVAGNETQFATTVRQTTATNLLFARGSATNNMEVSWFLVTFTGTSGTRVRNGVVNVAAAASKTSAAVSPAVASTRSASFIEVEGLPGGGTTDLDSMSFYANLNTAGSSLAIGRDAPSGAEAATVSWQVVEFTRPDIRQNRYRWRNDDGTEVTATAAAAENASISMAVGSVMRLRFGLYNADTGSATNQYRLEFTRKTAGGTCDSGLSPGWDWRQVPTAPSVASDAFDIEASANITDAAATTNVAALLTDDDTVFVAGETKDAGNQTSSIGLASTSFTEIEYALQANSNALIGGKYCFRLTDAGDARASHSFITYSQYAQAEVVQSQLEQVHFRWRNDDAGEAESLFLQRGTISAATTDETVTPPSPVDRNHAFVLCSQSMRTSAEGNLSTCFLQSNGQLRVLNNQGALASLSVDWHITEMPGIDVQHGSTSFATGDTVVNATLPTAVDTSRSFVIVTTRTTGTAANIDEQRTITAVLTSGTNVQFQRNETGLAVDVVYQVVQMHEGTNVYPGTSTIAGGSTTAVATLTGGRSVDVDRSFLIFSTRAAAAVNGVEGQFATRGTITNSTQMTFARDVATNDINVAWFLVEVSDAIGDTVAAQRGTVSMVSGDFIVTASLSPAVITARTMTLHSSSTTSSAAGSSTDQDSVQTNRLLASSTDLQIERNPDAATANTTVTTDWSTMTFAEQASASFFADEDVAPELTKNITKRLRLEIVGTGTHTTQYRLEVSGPDPSSCAAASYTRVDSSADWDMVNSTHFTHGASTSNIEPGLTDEGATFRQGQLLDTTDQSGFITVTNGQFTELEYSLTPTDSATPGAFYCFRLTNAGSTTDFVYTQYASASIAIEPTFTQNALRWYTNADSTTLTDPWAPGAGLDLAENQATISAHFASPDRGTQIRLRQSIQVGTTTLTSGAQAFKLQFAEVPVGAAQCNQAVTWTDVGSSVSSSVWRFGSNTAVTDGTVLGATVLSVSDVAGTYEEGNNTATNPSNVTVGQDIEYDFSLQSNTPNGGSMYCFRVTESGGAVLTSYANYPTIITPPAEYAPEEVMRHGNFFTTQGYEQPYFWSGI